MPEHQALLRKIAILTTGLVVAYTMIAFDLLFGAAGGPGALFYAALAMLVGLGLYAAAWVFGVVEALTSTALTEFPPLVIIIWGLAIAALIVLLPLALPVLIVRYWRARRRFLAGTSGSETS
ncbi:MAG TPA: hypothetical protein EYH07_06410 [Kiloniellaceae bacterium]|nr:hypothetical protein [Kiloniellaceae bacterium]HIP78077.1 hypothetical protein [Kiloniellaceae bacterium]